MSREDVEAFWKWYDEVRGSLSTREVEKRAAEAIEGALGLEE